ncbi:MAG TPA: hypothetical protein DCM28_02970 [Phycisphaerales bacterium]|mgnify:CR=1 FL=1|nr:hypothetical protein [Phycisphaerales bacterium]|tara:strand:- start:2401 stop:2946 length:546 start_codon:yes stop_codon:yes gene_type:complete
MIIILAGVFVGSICINHGEFEMSKQFYVTMFLSMLSLLLIAGCETTGSTRTANGNHRVRVIRPNQIIAGTRWTHEERLKDVAIRSVRVTRNASYHLICLNTAEKPHVHDQHDLVVTTLSGNVRLHLNLKTYDLKPGDVVEIPRGTLHWAENLGGNTQAEAFAVFSPPYQGKDIRFVNVPKQ